MNVNSHHVLIDLCLESEPEPVSQNGKSPESDISGREGGRLWPTPRNCTDDAVIDLTLSDDDEDHDVDDDGSLESFKGSTRKRKGIELHSRQSDANGSVSNTAGYVRRRADAREAQERQDEALARWLDHQDNPIHKNQTWNSSTFNQPEINSFQETLAAFCASDNDYEVVSKVTKHLDQQLVRLGARQRQPLGCKIEQQKKLSSWAKETMKQLTEWRNRLIHEENVHRLTDVGTTREVFLQMYSRLLQELDRLPSQPPPPNLTRKLKGPYKS